MPLQLGTRQEVQAYYDSPNVNQSDLKKLLKDPKYFDKKLDPNADFLIIGSAVDVILTAGAEDFDREFYVSQVADKPSDAIAEMVEVVYLNALETYDAASRHAAGSEFYTFAEFAGELKDHEEVLMGACEEKGWNPKWGREARLTNLLKGGSDYFTDLVNSFGRKVISKEQHGLVNSITQSLMSHSRTSKYFKRSVFEVAQTITCMTQLAIYFTHEGVACKGLLDMVVTELNIEENTLYVTPIDIKTMSGNTMEFGKNLRNFRYDIQAAWYTLALKYHFADSPYNVVIKPFQFVVESTTEVGKPLVYEVSPKLLEIGAIGMQGQFFNFGGFIETRVPDLLGYEQLMELYQFHQENGFREERAIIESENKPLTLGWNGLAYATSDGV